MAGGDCFDTHFIRFWIQIFVFGKSTKVEKTVERERRWLQRVDATYFSNPSLQAEASQTPRDVSPQEPRADSDLSMQEGLGRIHAGFTPTVHKLSVNMLISDVMHHGVCSRIVTN